MSKAPVKQHLVTDQADRFKVSASDTGTELYRDILAWLNARKDRAKENGMKNISDEATQRLRGGYDELLSLEKSINPPLRPTSQEQASKLRKNQ